MPTNEHSLTGPSIARLKTGDHEQIRVIPRTRSGWVKWSLCSLGVLALPLLTIALTETDRLTLNKLQEQAIQAMGQGDPDGAAITIGKAALLASQIAPDNSGKTDSPVDKLLVSLYRTQEHTYRAIALFQQSGSQTPASFGVCQTVAQGMLQSAHSKALIEGHLPEETSVSSFHQQVREWEETLQELEKEFGCAR